MPTSHTFLWARIEITRGKQTILLRQQVICRRSNEFTDQQLAAVPRGMIGKLKQRKGDHVDFYMAVLKENG